MGLNSLGFYYPEKEERGNNEKKGRKGKKKEK